MHVPHASTTAPVLVRGSVVMSVLASIPISAEMMLAAAYDAEGAVQAAKVSATRSSWLRMFILS